jgi:hypothetical protein
MTAEPPRGTLDDLYYLVDCHRATGCLFQSADYGERINSGKLGARQWDLKRLNDGVHYLARSCQAKKGSTS